MYDFVSFITYCIYRVKLICTVAVTRNMVYVYIDESHEHISLTLKRKCSHIGEIFVTAAQEVVKMTTSAAVCDENFNQHNDISVFVNYGLLSRNPVKSNESYICTMGQWYHMYANV